MDKGTALLLVWLILPLPFLLSTIHLARKLKRARNETSQLKERFSPIVSVDEERIKVEAQIAADKAKAADDIDIERRAAERILQEIIQQTEAVQVEIEKVRATYSEKRALLASLQEKIAVCDERLAFAELGVYEPHFDFGDSKTFKDAITAVRARQKEYVSGKTVTCSPEKSSV